MYALPDKGHGMALGTEVDTRGDRNMDVGRRHNGLGKLQDQLCCDPRMDCNRGRQTMEKIICTADSGLPKS